jgi:hypothetical protein
MDMMKQRSRKFVGTFLTVGYLIAYSLVIMAIGGQYVVGNGMALELMFYVVAGVGWIPAAMAIIRWMAKPDPPPHHHQPN